MEGSERGGPELDHQLDQLDAHILESTTGKIMQPALSSQRNKNLKQRCQATGPIADRIVAVAVVAYGHDVLSSESESFQRFLHH